MYNLAASDMYFVWSYVKEDVHVISKNHLGVKFGLCIQNRQKNLAGGLAKL